MNNCKYKYIVDSSKELDVPLTDLLSDCGILFKLTSLHESERVILWRGSEGDLATDIGEFLSEEQIQELIMELSSEYQKKKRERLRNERV